ADWGTMAPRIGLETKLDYWSHSEEAFGVKASIHDVVLAAHGKYYFETANPKLMPFAGAGLAMNFVGAKVETPAQGGFPATSVSDSNTNLGLATGGGVTSPMGPRTDLQAELWYGIVSDVSQFSLRVGLSQKLGH